MNSIVEESWVIANAQSAAAVPAGRRPREPLRAHLGALARAARARRARRVTLLLIGTWVVSAFDLLFTLLAADHRRFVELNPIAASIIGNTTALVAYKILIVAVGSVILLKYRTRVLTEIGCWSVCAVYLVLAGIWWKFYFAYF